MQKVEFTISGNHTVGMLIQKYCELDDNTQFVSYFKTHPLENEICLKIACSTGDPLEACEHAIEKIIKDLDDLTANYEETMIR